MKPIERETMRSGHFKAGKLVDSLPVPIVKDNFVCAHCGKELGKEEFVIVSKPGHKGVVGFACKPCTGHVMRILDRAFGLPDQPPPDVKFPEPSDN